MNGRITLVASLVITAILGGCASQPVPAEVYRERGDRSYRLGDFEAAAMEYRLVADRYPGDWRAQYKLGLSELAIGNASAARQALEIAHTRRPDDRAVTDALALAIYEGGDAEGLFWYLRDQAESTQTVHAYLELARYSLLLDDPDSAKVAIDTALELDDGQSVEPYIASADLAERVGDLEVLRVRLRQAYGIAPGDRRIASRLQALGEVPGPTLALPPGR